MLTAAALAASTLVGMTAAAGPAAAAEDPLPGQSCTAADLGKRFPVIETARVEPTVTHFKSYFVTAGTTGSQQVTLEHSTLIEVTVNTVKEISATFDTKVLGSVTAKISQTVITKTASTDKWVQVITWNFGLPGYYGVYKGTRKVTGEFSAINCDRVDQGNGQFALEWVKRPGGSYTTFTSQEEGAIRCEDVVPDNTLMKLAQDRLGCNGQAAQDAAKKQAQAPQQEQATAWGDVGLYGVPTGFTCQSGWYRIGTPDGLLNWWNKDGTGYFDLRGRSSSERARFRVCTGPETNGKVEHIFISAQSGKCVTLSSDSDASDGIRFAESSCRTVDDRQRFYLYRDVPGSNQVGIQLKRNGYMVGQAEYENGEYMRQYSSGKQDGTGTYVLERI